MNTLAVFSDLHTNHIAGLNPPRVVLDEGNVWEASGFSGRLRGHYLQALDIISKEKKGKLTGIVLGDYVDLDIKKRSLEMVTRNPTEAEGMSCAVIEPFAKLCDEIYFIRGTEAHSGKSAWAEESVASNFDNAVVNETTKQYTWWHLPLEIEGVRIDIAHHPKGGGAGRPMNSQGSVDRLASDALFTYSNAGQLPPHLVIRGHTHRYADSRDAFRTRAMICPPFSLLTAHTRRIGINEQPDVGCLLIFIDRGRYYVRTPPVLFPGGLTEWIQKE